MATGKSTFGAVEAIGEQRALRQRAAEWLAIRQARRLTESEEVAFDLWRADARHAAAWADVEAADRIFDRLAFYPRDAGRPADPDLLVRARRRVKAWVTAATAAAALIAVAFFSGTRPAASNETTVMPIAAGVRFLRLPDGSRVELNSGSEVAEHFTASERRIRLVRGEAHFDVAKNPLRPFIVEADSVAVQAVGTAFDVRLGPTAVDVLVTEGRVGVTTAGAHRALPPTSASSPGDTVPGVLGPGLILSAGQRTEVPTTPPPDEASPLVVEDLTQHQIDRALAWQSSRLVFDEM